MRRTVAISVTLVFLWVPRPPACLRHVRPGGLEGDPRWHPLKGWDIVGNAN